MPHATREAWLLSAVKLLREDFDAVGATIPDKVRVTCGWPSTGGRPGKKQVLGQCWPPSCSEDEHFEVFINPMIAEPVAALEVLVHELVHTVVGTELGHKGAFRTTAQAIGLVGKMTATSASEELTFRLHDIKKELVKYPHAKLTPIINKPQSTRMLKVTCPACQWSARTSRKWIDLGLPTCACGTKMEEAE